ncbi:hypothetical protein FB451DRAFT_590398 [Mycena latifolia]|nr:hypothetical protein FB451DRAFT_590398 [Mycena latifolia]
MPLAPLPSPCLVARIVPGGQVGALVRTPDVLCRPVPRHFISWVRAEPPSGLLPVDAGTVLCHLGEQPCRALGRASASPSVSRPLPSAGRGRCAMRPCRRDTLTCRAGDSRARCASPSFFWSLGIGRSRSAGASCATCSGAAGEEGASGLGVYAGARSMREVPHTTPVQLRSVWARGARRRSTAVGAGGRPCLRRGSGRLIDVFAGRLAGASWWPCAGV